MITTRMPKEIRDDQMLEMIDRMVQQGIKSVELDVHLIEKIVVFTDFKEKQEAHQQTDCLELNRLLAHLSRHGLDIQVILNLKEPYLENRVKSLVDKWGLKKQVFYSGKLQPMLFTPWDKPYIHYNIENCLPNVYQFEKLKRAHFDVIHYFCKKYKIQTIRLPIQTLTEDIIGWSEASNLKLSVYGISTLEKARELIEIGIEYAGTVDSSFSEKSLLN